MCKIVNGENRKPRINTFPKLLVSLIVLHGILCVTASYVLAFMGYTDTVENLSITIIGEIISPTVSYIIANVFTNIFEKNKLSFSTPLSRLEQEDMMAGMNENINDNQEET